MPYRLTFQSYNNTAPTTTDAISINFDIAQTLNIGSQSTGAGAGKVTFNPFTFTRHPDAFSPQLFSMCCTGTPFHKVTLEVSALGAHPDAAYFTFTMGLAAVKTLAFSSADPDGHILEVVTLEYGQAAVSITPQNPDGTLNKAVASGWDRVKNIAADPTKIGTL